MSVVRKLLAHPLTRGLDIDAPETSILRRRIIQEKPFLNRVYHDWYTLLQSSAANRLVCLVEIGIIYYSLCVSIFIFANKTQL